jgi:hypothetical protein
MVALKPHATPTFSDHCGRARVPRLPPSRAQGGLQTRADPSNSSMSRFRRCVRGAGQSESMRLRVARDSSFVNTLITVLTCAYAGNVGSAGPRSVLPLSIAEGVLVT